MTVWWLLPLHIDGSGPPHPHGSLLSLIKCKSLYILIFFLPRVAGPPPGHHGGVEAVWLWHRWATPRPAQSPSSIHTPHVKCVYFIILYNLLLSMKSVNGVSVVLFCTRSISWLSVRPGRGILLFLRVLPSFFFLLKPFFIYRYC